MDDRMEHGMTPRNGPAPGPETGSDPGHEGGVPAARGFGWRSTAGFRTHPGCVRERNEDAYAVYLPYAGERNRAPVEALFAVADGMGGHRAGDVASRYAAEAVQSAFGRPDGDEPTMPVPDLPAWIRELFGRINRELSARDGTGRGQGMGSTLTLALVRDGRLYLGHVGDSRCYRFRDGALEQLTPDHSWVAEQRRAGLLSEEEARRHPKRNLLTQCLGLGRDLDLFVAEEALEDGARYLLCSDGLHGPVPDPVTTTVLSEEADPQAAASRLVELALEAGAPDNVTAVVFDVRRGLPLGNTLPDAPEGPARLLALSGEHERRPAGSGSSASGPTGTPAPGLRRRSDGPWSRLRAALPSRRRHRLLLLAGILLTVGGGGAGGWLLLRPSVAEETSASPSEETPAAPETSAPAAGQAAPETPSVDSSGPDPPGDRSSTGAGEEGG